MKIRVGGIYVAAHGGRYVIKPWESANDARRMQQRENTFYAVGKGLGDWLILKEDGYPYGYTKKEVDENRVLKKYIMVKEINALNI